MRYDPESEDLKGGGAFETVIAFVLCIFIIAYLLLKVF